MSTTVSEIVEEPKAPTVGRKRSDFFYYGLRNKKLVFGLGLELLLVLFAIIGPMIAKYGPQDLTGAQLHHPNGTYWLGTDNLGQDIFSQLANGLGKATWWARSAPCRRRSSAWRSGSPRAGAAASSTRSCR